MKKHILPFVLCLILCFCAVGCSSGSDSENESNGNNGSQSDESQSDNIKPMFLLTKDNYENYLFITYTYQKEKDAVLNAVHVTYFITVRSRNPSYEFFSASGIWGDLEIRNKIALVFYDNNVCYLDSWGNGYVATTHKYVSPYSSIEVPKARYVVGWVA